LGKIKNPVKSNKLKNKFIFKYTITNKTITDGAFNPKPMEMGGEAQDLICRDIRF
jgi:hypothetical protein